MAKQWSDAQDLSAAVPTTTTTIIITITINNNNNSSTTTTNKTLKGKVYLRTGRDCPGEE